MQATTLNNLLEAATSTSTGITYLRGQDNEKHISYSALRDRAFLLLGQFQNRGLVAGDHMILLTSSNVQFVDAFWACILGGIVPVPLATGISSGHREKILGVFNKLHQPYIYTTQDSLTRLQEFSNNSPHKANINALSQKALLIESITQSTDKGIEHKAQPQDPAFIQFSSGSTNTPKGVQLTHANLLANLEAMMTGARLSQNDSTLGWMPLTHDMGLIGFHLVPLAQQIPQYLIPTDLFVRRPAQWMAHIVKHKVTVTCSPNFGFKHFLQYFNSDDAKDWKLAHLRLILNGAEPISADLCRAFLTKMEAFGLSNKVMFPVYGLAEACLAVTFPLPGTDFSTTLVNRFQLRTGDPVELVPANSPKALELVKVGSPVRHCGVKICNDQGVELPDMTVGHILISGKNVTSGYYQDDQLNEQMITAHGLDTGDLGFIQDGQLVVCGRSKDILFINGQNYYPHDLEFALEELPGMELGKAVVCGATRPGHQDERPVVFALHKGDIKDFAHMIPQVRQKLNEYAGLEVNTVLPVRQIPKTTSGKVQRYQLAAQYSEGAFHEVEERIEEILNRGKAAYTAEEANKVESTLLAICQEFLENKSIGINDNLFELGTSSLVLTQIHDRIDEIWPGKLELTDYFDYPTIAELAQYLDDA